MPIGSSSPLKAPAKISSVGRGRAGETKIVVVSAMKATTRAVRTRSLVRVREVMNETVVYDAPITLVMAAAHSTIAEDPQPDLAGGRLEGVGRLVLRVELDALADDAEDRQEQDHPHHAGDEDAGHRAAGDVADPVGALHAGVEQPVGAGVDDVAADGAADQRGDREELVLVGITTVRAAPHPRAGRR